MKALGAKVILTPAEERGSGMVRRAEELAKKHGWFLSRQFENEANPRYHRNTTGPEILRDFADRDLNYFVSGWGTGGTMTGAGEIIKLARPETQIVVAEPENAALLSGKEWSPHKIQGWTPDFIPRVLKKEVADKFVPVSDDESIEVAKKLAKRREFSLAYREAQPSLLALKQQRLLPKTVRFALCYRTQEKGTSHRRCSRT